jgi:hypothetical protein
MHDGARPGKTFAAAGCRLAYCVPMRLGSVFSSHVTATQEYIFTEGHGRAPGEQSIRGNLEARSHQILRELDGERRTPWDDVLAVHIHPLRWHWWVPFVALAGGIVLVAAGVVAAAVAAVGALGFGAYLVFDTVRDIVGFLTGAEFREMDREERRKAGRETPRDLRIRARREDREQRRQAKKERASARKEASQAGKRSKPTAANAVAGAGAASGTGESHDFGAVGGFGGWAPSGPAPDEPLEIDLDAPWGNIAVRVVTVDGPVDVLVRQRLFVRTTRADAAALEARYAALIADPALRATLPDRDR